MKTSRFFLQPLSFPILFFGVAILLGSGLLVLPISQASGHAISWTDALFTAASATCVTGLTVVDTGSSFSATGRGIILFLIQIGGLGIMTLTSLAMYLLRQRITLTDRIAVGQNLLQDPRFHLGRFLLSILTLTLCIELCGAFLLFLATKGAMSPFSALFHSVSAFCNAGFSLYGDSLTQWADNPAVNLVFMILIILGGIGFFVLVDVGRWFSVRIRPVIPRGPRQLSWYSSIILQTSALLILGGAGLLFIVEGMMRHASVAPTTALLTSLFQSVTCRTAGFNTVAIGDLTNVTLLIMMGLMLIGASPGSCGGGIKVTTFRVLVAFVWTDLRDREQVVIGRMAADRETIRRALALFIFSSIIITTAILILCLSETGALPHDQTRGQFLEITFEVISAYATVGLSTGLTPTLSITGKYLIIALMFIGRLGPLLFIGALHTLQQREPFSRPEADLLIG